ncbi:hypothetical protein GALMADRAFT_146431 [Galerina marginata CBS 339.88]|uniref:FAD-binding PCMH-type domain-containing protein n=1 Tax=Galerina marginata (strain CBS 339.88) TaxID=685588 RepID=A0A067SN24_GALM3|nr:hypothetical protein GALMADRAFT_146431 [Galerina marginata CBS 339.88]
MPLEITYLLAIIFYISIEGTLAANSTAFRTCAQLQGTLGPDIIQFSGPEYLNASTRAYSLFNTEDRPTCIVFPRETSHVQVAMAAIFLNEVHYAVRAGGHAGMTGWNTVQDGILFSFANMNNVSYNAAKDTITLQPGVRWGQAVAQLESQKVAPLGGRLPDVGTGLLLGGGLNYFGAEHGFSCDAFVEVDVVLVTGQLVTATANNEHSALFRALKGGANRFGIATRFEVQAVHDGTGPDKNWFGGLISYPNSSTEALLHATQKFTSTVNDPKAAILLLFLNLFNGSQVTGAHSLTLLYRGSSLPLHIFGDFLSIPSTSKQISSLSYLEALNLNGPGTDIDSGALFGSSAVSGDVDAYFHIYRVFNEFTLNPVVRDSLSLSFIAFTPIFKSQILAGRARGSNSFDPPLVNYAAIHFETTAAPGLLQLPSQVEAARQAAFSNMPPSAGLPLYQNESDKKQKVFATYGRFDEMKRTYKKYDPTRFNARFTEGPLGV